MQEYPLFAQNNPANWFKGENTLFKALEQEEKGDRGGAIRTLKAALPRFRGSRFEPRVRAVLARMLVKNLRFKEAFKVIDGWPLGREPEMKALIEAEVLLGMGRPQSGVYLLQREISMWSREGRCKGYLLLGDGFGALGRSAEQADTYRRFLEHRCPVKVTPSKLVKMALALERIDKDSYAEKALSMAIEKGDDATVVEATFWLGDLFEKESKTRDALVRYLQVGYGLPSVFPWNITARYRAAVLMGRDPETRGDAVSVLKRIALEHQGDRWGEAALREMRRIKADEGSGSTP